MTTAFDLVTFDSPDPDHASRFWCSALDLHVTEREDDGRWVVLSDAAHTRRIGLQRGRVVPGSVHLDLVCEIEEFHAEHHRLVALGAVEMSAPRHLDYGWIVNLSDPDGNRFDLCAYA